MEEEVSDDLRDVLLKDHFDIVDSITTDPIIALDPNVGRIPQRFYKKRGRSKIRVGTIIIVGGVAIVFMVTVLIVVLVYMLKNDGSDKESNKVRNVVLSTKPMEDPNLHRLAYGFKWDKPKKKGTWYYSYTIMDSTGYAIGPDNRCTADTFAMITPYISVVPGAIYSIEIYSSEKSNCFDKDTGSRVVVSGSYPNTPQKPQFGWDIKQDSATPMCDTWIHVVPSNFFAMLGSYKVTVVDKKTGNPIKLGQITYWKVSMFPNNANLQYSLPFNLTGEHELLIQIIAENKAGSTILNNLNCSFPTTLPVPGKAICSS